MRIFNGESMLELAELVAKNEWATDAIVSEEGLSIAFDGMLEECCPNFNLEDKPALREAFYNYSDSLYKEGKIHESQYNAYTYCGVHNID